MKKLFGFLVMVMIGMTACEGPPGRDGVNAKPTDWKNVNFQIFLDDWMLQGEKNEIGSYYYYVFDAPEITENIYDNGLIICNYLYTDDVGYDVQSILPYTEYFIDTDNFGEESRFAMHFSYSVMPTVRKHLGTIEFRVTFSDFYTGEKGPPEECNFKLTLVN